MTPEERKKKLAEYLENTRQRVRIKMEILKKQKELAKLKGQKT